MASEANSASREPMDESGSAEGNKRGEKNLSFGKDYLLILPKYPQILKVFSSENGKKNH